MTNTKKSYVFDFEGDGFYPTKIWCVTFYSINEDRLFTLTNYDEIRKVFLESDTLIGHNIIRFDIPHLERLLGISLEQKFIVDTLGLSWYLYHDNHLSGLEFWAKEFSGREKVQIKDWHNLPLEEYIKRCEEDVRINTQLWTKFQRELFQIYETSEGVIRCIKYLNFKMKCLMIQETNKWKVSRDEVSKRIEDYEKIQASKFEAIGKVLPKVPVYVKKTRPKNLLKKDGSLSSHGEKWQELCKKHGVDIYFDGEIKELREYVEPNPGSTDQVKDWLFSLGWVPQTLKETKSSVTGEVKQVPQINLPHGKGVCESVLALADKEPAVLELDSLSVLNHRIPQLKTLLNNLDVHDQIEASAAGLTNTLRFKHQGLVNLPKPEKPFGGIRSCLTVKKSSTILCGCDMASLEDRIKQHFIWDYDPEYVKSMMQEDFDPHLTLARMADAVTDEQVSLYKQTGDKYVKKIRDTYKNGNYALI
jgi:hypothetical protein